MTFRPVLGPLAIFAMLLAGCPLLDVSNCNTGSGGGGGGTTSPYQEVYDAGLTRYVGTPEVQPASVDDAWLYAGVEVNRYSTDPAQGGPLCMRGDEYFVETREGDSDALVIYLQAGGVCTTEVCAATVTPSLNLRLLTTGDLIGLGGILDKSDSRNPFADWDLVHVPYCDGSIFMGDIDRVLSDGDDSNGTRDMAYQRGLQNLTAAFEAAKVRFPNPSRVVVAGSSGGSYGSVAAIALARYYFPGKELLAVVDSGAPVLTDSDPGLVDRILREVNARQFVPASCVGCIDDGHVTGVVHWALERDPRLTVAYMGHSRDFVIGEFFMGGTAAQHQAAVLRETGELLDRWPGRAFRFITAGQEHTYLLDVDYAPGWLQEPVLYVFGPLLFTGPDVTASDISRFILGGMRESGPNEAGDDTDAYEWLNVLVNDPDNATNVVGL